MKRYYLSPIISGPDEFGSITYQAKLNTLPGLNVVCEIPTGPDGIPTQTWALCLASGPNHTAALADREIDALPDVSLDVKVGAIQNATKTRMKNALTARGLPGSIVDNADGYRDVIRAIGRFLNLNFDENHFDVLDA